MKMTLEKMTYESLFCGGIITILAFLGFLINIKVLHVLYKKFLDSKHNSIYIIAFVNIFNNTVQLFVSTVYLGPTSIMQQDYFEGGMHSIGTKLFSWAFLGSWYCDMILQPVASLNRFIMVVLPHHGHLFSKRNTAIISVLTFLFSYILAYISDFVISCCIAYVYYGYYSYAYLQTEYNYVNYFIDLPINTSGSAISILLYVIIFIYVKRNNARASQFNRDLMTSRKIKEVRYAIQFAFCSIFALFAWVTFRVFPVVVPPEKVAWFTFIAIFLIAHSVGNSLIFICFNKEFKDKFFNKPLSSSLESITASKTHEHHSKKVGDITHTNTHSTHSQNY